MKKYLKYILVFLFFLVLLNLSPISGDDWGNYIVGSEGLRHSIGVAIGMYFDWEGRFISRVLINILTYHKWLWNICNALVISGIIYLGVKFVEKPKRFVFPLICLTILGMNLYTFSQVVSWVAGNITYLFVVPIILGYFYYILHNDKYNKWFFFIFCLLNIITCMFVENMAVVVIGGNILLLIYKYIKNRKIDRRLIVYLVLSIGATLAMLLSPGTRYRSSVENLEFNNLNIFEKVGYNIPNFVYYTFIINTFMLVVLNFSNYYIIRDYIKNKWLKYLLIIFMLSISTLTIFLYPLSMFVSTRLDFIINQNNLFIIGYWIIYLLITFGLLFLYDKDLKYVFLFLVGLCSNVAMLISPTWGFRTSFFTYLMFSITAINVINYYVKESRLFGFILNSGMYLGFIVYLVFYINIFRCQSDLAKSIDKQIKEDKDTIYISSFPSFANCNINPDNPYHIEKFKAYYGISADKEIKLVDDKWRAVIFYTG